MQPDQVVSPDSISLVVMTRNEEANLPGFLENLAGFDEVVVADMESDDATVAIARSAGGRVLPLPNAGFAEPGRMDAVRFATGTWVLMLDADERLPAGGVDAVRGLCGRTPPRVAAYRIPRVNYLGDRPIRGSGWGLDVERHARLFRRDAVTWAPKVHSSPEFAGEVLDLPNEGAIRIEHANFRDYAHLLEKLNGYSTIEADELLESGGHPTLAMALRFALEEMSNRYDPEADGPLSLALSVAMFGYRFACHAKAVGQRDWADQPVIGQESLRAAIQSFWSELRRRELAAAASDLSRNGADAMPATQRVLSVWQSSPPQLKSVAATTLDGLQYEVPAAQFAADELGQTVASGLEQVGVRVELRRERRAREEAEAAARQASERRLEAEELFERTTDALEEALQRLSALEVLLAESQAEAAALSLRLPSAEAGERPGRPSLVEPGARSRVTRRLRRGSDD
ncbi:MAG TPA: glycosyltransferase family 2 protein [Acidimicrobiales bacterium]|nr:glycosyltransferase family 2 protein [Acidimicrobiales bacterium]